MTKAAPAPIEQATGKLAPIRSSPMLGYTACAVAGTFWGLGFFFGKIGFTQLQVGHFVLYRVLFACLVLLPVLKRPRFTTREWILVLIAAFCGVPVQFMLQFQGLKLTTVSHAALMVGTMPVILAAGATLFTKERLDAKGWLALLGSAIGIVLIVRSSSHGVVGGGNAWGDLLVVVSMLISLVWILLNRSLILRGHSPVPVTAWGVIAGTAMLAVWVVLWSGPPPVHGLNLRVWLAAAASGALCTASSTLLWNWGIGRVPASRAGIFLNIEPALGSILGVFLLGERLGPGAWAGGILIIIAAAILTTTGTLAPLE